MDAATRKQLIFEKANANAQRREREKLLEAAPPALCELLSASDCIFTPESDAVLRKFLPITAAGIGSPQFLPAGYSFREFAWETKLFASLHRTEELSEGPAYLSLRPPHGVFFEDNEFYVPDLPVFVVEFRVAGRMLEKLWSSACRFIALVSVDASAGVVIDNYTGYLPDDFNASEVVYEVASSRGDRGIPCG
jgi:hypothetical protein